MIPATLRKPGAQTILDVTGIAVCLALGVMGFGVAGAAWVAIAVVIEAVVAVLSALAGVWMFRSRALGLGFCSVAAAMVLALAWSPPPLGGALAAGVMALPLAMLHAVSLRRAAGVATRRVPVIVLTGFLGSGKTTILRYLLGRQELADSAVIINEFGEVGIDHFLVEKVDERMMRLSTGCLCCTVRGDILETLRDLFARVAAGEIPPFTRVLVETTGLADPAPILHALMTSPAAQRRCRVGAVIAVVDAVHGLATLERHAEAVKQVAVADRLLMTKLDAVASAAEAAALRERLRSLNPGAPVIEVEHGCVEPAVLVSGGDYDPSDRSADVRAWLAAEAYVGHEGRRSSALPIPMHDHADHEHAEHDHGGRHRHAEDIAAFCVVREAPVAAAALTRFMDVLRAEMGPDLLRVKGLVCLREEPEAPVVIHGVQHVFHPPQRLPAWPSDDHRTKLVFITRGMERQSMERLLSALERTEVSLRALS